MMEHTTDRLFWTLTSVIVGALILTLGINAFPKATQSTLQTFSGITRQADTATGHVSDAASEAINDSTSDDANNSLTTRSGDNNNNNQSTTDNSSNATNSNTPSDNNSNSSTQLTPAQQADATAKANAVDQSQTNVSVTDNGDGTATVTGLSQTVQSEEYSANGQPSNLVIPEYVKVNNNILKITAISNNAFSNDLNGVKTVTFPSSLTTIGTTVNGSYDSGTFRNAGLSEIYIPSTVSTILPGALQYAGSHITAPKALQSQVMNATTLPANDITFY